MLALVLDREVCKHLSPLVRASGEEGFVVYTAYPLSVKTFIQDFAEVMRFTRCGSQDLTKFIHIDNL